MSKRGGGFCMKRFRVKLSVGQVATRLEIFYHEKGGWRLLPKLEKQPAEGGRIYTLIDGWGADSAPAEIILEPLSDSETEVTLRANAGVLWDLRLDSPRAVLDQTAYLGGDPSPRCKSFLIAFKKHIQQREAEQQRAETTNRRGGPRRLEDREDAEEKRRLALQYLREVRKGKPKKVAAELQGYSYKTLDRWVDRFGLKK